MARRNLNVRAERRNYLKDKDKTFIEYREGQLVLVKEHRLSSAEDKQIRKLFLLIGDQTRLSKSVTTTPSLLKKVQIEQPNII